MSAVTSPPGAPASGGRRRPPSDAGSPPGRQARPGPRHRQQPARNRLRALAGRGIPAALVCAAAFGGGAGVRAAVLEAARTTPVATTAARSGSVTDAVAVRRQEIIRLLQEHYYRPVDADRLRSVPVEELPAVLADPYTHYLKPETLAAWNRTDTGRYVGIGVVVDTGTAVGLRVTTVLPGGPASAAGIRPGDEITQVDGHDTITVPVPDALELVRGDPGTSVTLTLQGDDGRRTLTLTRAEVQAQLVTTTLTPVATGDGDPPVLVGVVRLVEFDQHVGDQVRRAVAELTARGARRLVLDLRGNPGGLIDETLAVTSAFVPAGTPVYSRQGLHLDEKTYRTTQPPVAPHLPLTVLIDHDTASAAEIVAGALQDAHRAALAGTTSYGKGVMQQSWPLTSGGGVKITVAEFLTPAGHHIQHTGIHPDRP